MRPGYGGGALRLVVRNQLLLRGLITADGTSCVPSVDGAGTSGGGAGGSVWITVTNGPLLGPPSGRISASGGDGCPNGGGGGSGGRIAVYAVNGATGYSGMFLTASGASLAQNYLVNQQYVGCYVDSTNGVQALPNLIYSNQAGYQACFNQAKALGYRYVGLESWSTGAQALANAGECWAGNSLITAEAQGAASSCALLGTSDGNVMWGGAFVFALYDLLSVGVTSNPSVVPLYTPAGGTIFAAGADGTHGILTAADGNALSNMGAPVTFAGSSPSYGHSSSNSGTPSAPLDLVVLTNCDLLLNTPGRSLRTTAILSMPHANCSSNTATVAYNGPHLSGLVARMAYCRNASVVARPPPRLAVGKGFALGVMSDLNVTGYVLDLYNATLILAGNLSVGAHGTLRLSASTTTVVSVNATDALAIAHRGIAIQPSPTSPVSLKVCLPYLLFLQFLFLHP